MEIGVCHKVLDKCCCCTAEGYHENEFGILYFEIFKKCLNMNLGSNSRINRVICSTCVDCVKEIQQFRRMVISSQRQLRDVKYDNTIFIDVCLEETEDTLCMNGDHIKIEDENNINTSELCLENKSTETIDNKTLYHTIKTGQNDVLSFDAMIGNSDDSNDGLVENSGQFCPEFVTCEQNQTSVATALTASEVGNLCPCDESDVDPKTTDYDINDSIKSPFDNESINPMIKPLEKQRTKIFKRSHEKDIGEDGDDRSQNLLVNDKSVVIKKNPASGEITVEKDTKKITKKRKWDRKNACFYCQAIVTNYSRHLLRNHPDEIEVLQYKAINDDDPKTRKRKRQEITDKLRNKGNFVHNSKVTLDRSTQSILLPSKRRDQGTSNPSNYATCKTCLGTFKRLSFFRHLRNCRASANIPSLKTKALLDHSLTIVPNTANTSIELKETILSHLRSDDISLIVKNDPLIIAYGGRLLKKKKERCSPKAICSKMRDLATLLTVLRKNDKTIENLADAMLPEKYDIFLGAIKEMCGFDEETGMIKVVSVPARVRSAVLGCVEILYTQSVIQTDTTTAYKEAYKTKLDDFKRLIEINWECEVSSNAEKCRKRKHITR